MPNFLSPDNDPHYRFHQWQANLRILEVTEIKSVPYVPLSHPGSKITAFVLDWVEDSVDRSDSRGFGVAGSFSPCAFALTAW
jgi:hypothetical protein